MAATVQSAIACARTRPAENKAVHFVVRQPVVDLRGRVHAFKLLFREMPLGPETVPDGRQSLRAMASFGLEKPSQLKSLTGALAAFVECSQEMFSAELAHALPATLAILEIPSALDPSAEIVRVCHDLKTLGFRLALNGIGQEPLVDLADYVAIDFDRTDPEMRRNLCYRMRNKRAALLADKVQTQARYAQARAEGFSLFAGSYYYQPVAAKDRRPPANQLLRIEILKGVQQRPLDLHKMSQLVMRDGPLTFQLLRFVNSPICALRQEVQSIETALLTLGDDTFRRIATLAIASQFNGNQPAEVLCMAIIRGRFCEVAGLPLELDPFNQYLLGLLSLMPAMQGLPMSEIAPALPLSIEVRDALMGTKNRARALLGWLESYEQGDWDACDAAALANGLNQEEMARHYIEAVAWAESALHSTP